MSKTIIIEVGRQRMHPKYKKIIRRTSRIKAHCEDPSVKVGEVVIVVSCRPLSKEKHYRFTEKVAI